FLADSAKHHANLFAVVVGQSSRSRKGTSWNHIRRILANVDPEWAKSRVMGGVGSGEGIIFELKDEEGTEPKDKRLLIFESEFATVLRVMQREGNILSPILRQAWDCGELRNLVKNAPLKADNCHLSLCGHITKDELSKLLSDNDTANGFANRVLWVHAHRTKELPDGADMEAEDFSKDTNRLIAAVKGRAPDPDCSVMKPVAIYGGKFTRV